MNFLPVTLRSPSNRDISVLPSPFSLSKNYSTVTSQNIYMSIPTLWRLRGNAGHQFCPVGKRMAGNGGRGGEPPRGVEGQSPPGGLGGGAPPRTELLFLNNHIHSHSLRPTHASTYTFIHRHASGQAHTHASTHRCIHQPPRMELQSSKNHNHSHTLTHAHASTYTCTHHVCAKAHVRTQARLRPSTHTNRDTLV